MEPQTLVNTAASSTLDLQEHLLQAIEAKLYKHPIYQHYLNLNLSHSLQNIQNAQIKEIIRPRLTCQTLEGKDKINLRSKALYVIDDKFLTEVENVAELADDENNFTYTFFHLGHKLSGHDQIIHGGLLATILDELTCVLAFQNFRSKKGVTANLNINYLKPLYVDSYVMIKCTLVKKTGRKCVVKGQVYLIDLDTDYSGKSIPNTVENKSNLLTECECLIIEPRWVHELKNNIT